MKTIKIAQDVVSDAVRDAVSEALELPDIEVEICVSDVGLHFDAKGITAMVEFYDQAEDETAKFLIDWDNILGWCMASSQEEPDSEIICQRLRAVAAKLQEWSESDGSVSFKHAKIDRGDFQSDT